MRSRIVQRDAKTLAAGYGPRIRMAQFLAIVLFFGMCAVLGGRLAGLGTDAAGWLILATLAGWVSADFASGLVHWAGDTWGTTELPIVGQSIIRTFREHHVDEKSITRHDWVETNGLSCMAPLPLLGAALAIDLAAPTAGRVFAVAFILALSVWVVLTNQIHSWAHEDAPPRWVRLLQRSGLILGPEHHRLHHAPPYDRYYCITTGWLNPVLTRLDFFRRAEAWITAVTGAVPRKDDLGIDAALEIMERARTAEGAEVGIAASGK